MTIRRLMTPAISMLAVTCVIWAVGTTTSGLLNLRSEIAAALWTVPVIIVVHLLQLCLSARAWHALLPAALPGLPICFRLRIVREGINSLLPVARVGGEVVATGLLVAHGMTAPTAGASIIVDVTVELVTQIVFLLGGLAGLAAIGGKQETWAQVLPAGLAGISTAVALLLALRFGMLQLIEMLIRQIAKRGPNIGSFDGLESAARGIARARGRLFRAGSLHMVTWMIGAVETWLVLRALGHPVGPAQALVIESLGMAARSAGFAVPGALGVQEGGFMLACAAFGVPQTAGLSLSLIKRVREVLIGILGLALWRWPAPDHSPSIGPAGI